MTHLLLIPLAISRQLDAIARAAKSLSKGELKQVVEQLRSIADELEHETWRRGPANGTPASHSETLTDALIPSGVYALRLNIERADDGGWIRQNGTLRVLACLFTVLEGPYAERQFRQSLAVAGDADQSEIGAARLRGILESTYGIKPRDESDAAKAARRCPNGYADFDGMRFLGRVAISDGRNLLSLAITPDRPDYRRIP